MAQRLEVEHALRIDDQGVMHVTAAFRERLKIEAVDMKIETMP
jgi:hypothetical protein